MKIGIPIAEFHRGNTGEYVERAVKRLGHEGAILNSAELINALSANAFDLYLAVDSGGTFDFGAQQFEGLDLSRIGFWFIDYRHHWDGRTRTPGDLQNARILSERGGWVFQSQLDDVAHSRAHGVTRVSWLPLAADIEVWNDQPSSVKLFDLSFVGNVWDQARANALERLLSADSFKFGFFGHGKLWKEDGAKLLRASRCGFNISSYFGESWAYDVNMRVFETLSCGVPLITNSVPSLFNIFPADVPFIKTYESIEQLVPTVRRALNDMTFLNSGSLARQFVAENCRYEHRVAEALKVMCDVER